jgi:hypothetical protein
MFISKYNSVHILKSNKLWPLRFIPRCKNDSLLNTINKISHFGKLKEKKQHVVTDTDDQEAFAKI